MNEVGVHLTIVLGGFITVFFYLFSGTLKTVVVLLIKDYFSTDMDHIAGLYGLF